VVDLGFFAVGSADAGFLVVRVVPAGAADV
jgi:hypothetical protein